jgi:WD40 repeat protein
MGVVYKAYDRQLRRVVALKVLLAAEHAAEEEIGRFLTEASSAGQLQHPNIVPIHELKVHEGRHYYTMDFIDGQPLDVLIRDGSLNARQSLELVEKVARALHHSHQRGIIHRDIKPANIIVEDSGEPKVTDFGLAKVMTAGGSGSGGLTRSGTAIGTPHYEAPEQASGRGSEVDARTDVYSLGCVLYEMLAGAPPFVHENPIEILRMHIDADPVPPRKMGAKICEDIETIVLKCLEKEPGRRYQSAGELADDIGRFLNGEPITARRASLAYIIRKKLSRHRTIACVTATGMLLLVLATAFYVADLQRKNRIIEAERDKAVAATEAENRLRRLAELESYRYAISEADRLLATGLNGEARRLLDSLPEPLRGWEHAYLLRRAETGSNRKLLDTLIAGEARCIVLSPDGERLAVGCVDGVILLGDVAAGAEGLRRIASGSGVNAAVFSPDGQRLATGHANGQIGIWETSSGRAVARLTGHASGVTALAHSRSAALLASCSADDTVRLWDTAAEGGPRATAELPCSREPVALAFGPDGGRLAWRCRDGTLSVLSVAKQVVEFSGRDEGGEARSLCFSGDGQRLLTWGRGDWVGLRTADAGQEVLRLGGHAGGVVALATPPEGSTAVTCDANGTVREWDLRTGQTLRIVRGTGAVIPTLTAMSADGGKLAHSNASRELSVWAAGCATVAATFQAHPGGTETLAMHPDGNIFATCSRTGAVCVWEYRNEDQAPVKLAATNVGRSAGSLAFVRDGRFLAITDRNGKLAFWDWRGDEPRDLLPGGEAEQVTELSPGGKLLAVGSSDGVIVLHRTDDCKVVRTIRTGLSRILCIAFSPGSDLLAASDGDSVVQIWDCRKGTKVAQRDDVAGSVAKMAFRPDGKLLAMTTTGGMLKLWQLDNGHIVDRGGENISAFLFTPDGQRLISGNSGGSLAIWNAETGSKLIEIAAHRQNITALVIDTAGRRLSSSSSDGTVKTWDTQRQLGTSTRSAREEGRR